MADTESITAPPIVVTLLPWRHPELAGWSIVGMNHYGDGCLRISLARNGVYIEAQGADTYGLWERLRRNARAFDALDA